ncbi:MAG: DUF1801 domain-containing protein [Armatimonadetes bacterium]|nr:MAG: DUF1801 domain-containing protein [Armatimonadota bacterium]
MTRPNPPTTPEEYIAGLDEPRRTHVQTLFDLIRKAAPELEPWMVSGKIGFGKFPYQGKSKACSGEWFKLGLASNKNSIMFAYAEKLPKASIGRSCINFRKFEDVDLDVLREIAERTAKADFSNWMM